MSEQEDKPLSQPKRPTTNKRDDWHNYWKELGYTWRTEPEIDAQRQAELNNLRLILRDIDGSYEGSFYVFDENINLGRADVEWLLAAYIQEQKSANGSSDTQQQYNGLSTCN